MNLDYLQKISNEIFVKSVWLSWFCEFRLNSDCFIFLYKWKSKNDSQRRFHFWIKKSKRKAKIVQNCFNGEISKCILVIEWIKIKVKLRNIGFPGIISSMTIRMINRYLDYSWGWFISWSIKLELNQNYSRENYYSMWIRILKRISN